MKMLKEISNIISFIFLLIHKKRGDWENGGIESDGIHIITLRRFFPYGGAGGGGAVQSCNRILFGNELGSIPLRYSFYEDNKYTRDRKNDLLDLFGAVEFVKKKTQKDIRYVYVTHDYGTALGLYLLGKKYILVSHIQGSRTEEKRNFGEKFSQFSKKIIQYSEKLAFSGAYKVCFPSDGAYDYFCGSPYKIIKPQEFNKGKTLYNTLYSYPEPIKIDGIEQSDECITFLSIGQLTFAKGLDRHPEFFMHLLNAIDQKIRYIFVGEGIFETRILKNLNDLRSRYSNFSYHHIKGCSYPEIQYLQNISDVYLMLHRISIFDLSTLEVMRKGKAIVLSNVGGNPEFNRKGNIILCDGPKQAATAFPVDLKSLGSLNREVYERCFSNEIFKKSYLEIFEDLRGH